MQEGKARIGQGVGGQHGRAGADGEVCHVIGSAEGGLASSERSVAATKAVAPTRACGNATSGLYHRPHAHHSFIP
jgi:hypothetical protein